MALSTLVQEVQAGKPQQKKKCTKKSAGIQICYACRITESTASEPTISATQQFAYIDLKERRSRFRIVGN